MKPTRNDPGTLTAPDGTQQFLSWSDAEKYAHGAGWHVLTHQTDPVVCVRDDMLGVQYVLRESRFGRCYWEREGRLVIS
jgi:hypothetical protein